MKHPAKALCLLIFMTACLSACTLLQNPETREEREAPRLLDTDKEGPQKWYCYGETRDKWKCRTTPDPSLTGTLPAQPEEPPAAPPSPMTAPASPMTEMEPEPDPEPAVVFSEVRQTILDEPPDHYTVQLIAMQNVAAVESYAIANEVPSPIFVDVEADGERWHLLLLGTWPDRSAAENALAEWQQSRELEVTPWIRRLGPLQQAIRAAVADN